MRQVELTGIKNFECREVEQPAIGPGQAKIAVKAIGICGSDIHAYYGEHPFMDFPIVLGHECTGIIEEISGENTKLKKGDRVSVLQKTPEGTMVRKRGVTGWYYGKLEEAEK